MRKDVVEWRKWKWKVNKCWVGRRGTKVFREVGSGRVDRKEIITKNKRLIKIILQKTNEITHWSSTLVTVGRERPFHSMELEENYSRSWISFAVWLGKNQRGRRGRAGADLQHWYSQTLIQSDTEYKQDSCMKNLIIRVGCYSSSAELEFISPE